MAQITEFDYINLNGGEIDRFAQKLTFQMIIHFCDSDPPQNQSSWPPYPKIATIIFFKILTDKK